MGVRNLHRGVADLFVSRPILACVINVLIAIAGLAALTGVEVREMPDVDQPVLSVRVDWDGAAPETMDTEVTKVIEDSMAELAGMKSISSTSSYGSSRLTIELTDGTDIATAANDAREILASTVRSLPDGIDDPVLTKNDSNADPIIRLALIGEAPLDEMTDLAENLISDRLTGVDGVAEIQIRGEQENEFRISVNLNALVGRNLDFNDVQAALAGLRVDTAMGDLESGSQSVLLRSADPTVTVDTIADLRIDAHTRVDDVALVQYTAKERDSLARVGGQSAVVLNVIRQSVGNTLAISQDVRAAVAEFARRDAGAKENKRGLN